MFQSPSLLEQIFSFLIRPKYLPQVEKISPWRKLWNSFRTYNFFMLFSVLGIVISSIVLSKIGDGVENEVSNLASGINIWLFFFLVVIYAPLTEELIFRVWLRATTWNLAIGLAFIINMALSLLESYGLFPLTDYLLAFYTRLTGDVAENSGLELIIGLGSIAFVVMFNLLVIVGLISLFYLLFKKNPQAVIAVNTFYGKHFAWVFYASSLTFGLVHVTNYVGLGQFWWVAPLLVIPQIFAGLELGFVRAKWGIWWAIFNHAINNFIPFLIFFSYTFFSDEVRAAQLAGETSAVNYTNGDYIVLTLIGLGFIFLILINLVINILNFVELMVSLSKRKKTPVTTITENSPIASAPE